MIIPAWTRMRMDEITVSELTPDLSLSRLAVNTTGYLDVTLPLQVIVDGQELFPAVQPSILIRDGVVLRDFEGEASSDSPPADSELIADYGDLFDNELPQVILADFDQFANVLQLGSVSAALASAFESLGQIGDVVTGVAGWQQTVPVLGKSLSDLVHPGAPLKLSEAVKNYLNDPDPTTPGTELPSLEGLSLALADAIRTALGNVTGSGGQEPIQVSAGFDPITSQLRVDVAIDATATSGISFDLASAESILGIKLQGSTQLDVETQLVAELTIGVSLSNALGNFEGGISDSDIFIVLDELAARASVKADNVQAGVTFDALGSGLSIQGGTIDFTGTLETVVSDPDGDGRLTLAEIKNASNLGSLFSVTPMSGLAASLPLSGNFEQGFDTAQFGRFFITLADDDIFDRRTPQANVDVQLSAAMQGQVLALLGVLDQSGVALNSATPFNTKLPVLGRSFNALFSLGGGPRAGDFLKLREAAQAYFDAAGTGSVHRRAAGAHGEWAA